ncbi:hypothetical protein DW972_00110 [Anaerobutyricum hallii]|uniref:Uncharacterized protein n=1 Tax=Anaerobutyricum hallii TaxID=39488 RepID=A0A413Q1U9_9FIRM|nr:hypothetical protein DW972_00110 [Anaerobutyricum hallii]
MFSCAKHFILPRKTGTWEKRVPFLWSEFHSTKAQNSNLVFFFLFNFIFEQSDIKLLNIIILIINGIVIEFRKIEEFT